jgi:hypothetical protein
LYLPNRKEKVELLDNMEFGKATAPALLTQVEKVGAEKIQCCLDLWQWKLELYLNKSESVIPDTGKELPHRESIQLSLRKCLQCFELLFFCSTFRLLSSERMSSGL